MGKPWVTFSKGYGSLHNKEEEKYKYLNELIIINHLTFLFS